ncbi:histidine phosphotransferase family protein [Sulfitobacter sp. D35]|uniref:histidine phosphotransferase family protein n=1 Tax=Sulfitobacter sp. D35 TaxID=3083252 RepID=UPI00296EF7AB|nr:histidine phosphotransferase family protein [Sulfitobacter sp. D35]MDW4496545.1 histidine phosphotransferase family protein [Sulfitobacter sp. D35]
MGQSNISLAALIGSRICHDLISPIGAINNGLELLGMSGGTPGPEMELIQESVGNASARIRFFRIAFGHAGEQMMGRSEVISILNAVMQGGRLKVAWGPLDPQPRCDVRMVFLALQCLENAMPYGGRIEIVESRGAWQLHGRADKLNIDDTLWSILATRDLGAVLQPAQVQFALLPMLALETGRRVVTEISETELRLGF